jgi:hypothetical protein
LAGIFRTRQPFLQTNSWQNQALNALHYNTSQAGSVVPIIYGTARQQVNLVNFANYIGPQGKKGKAGSLPITGTSNTGKGGGSSKGKGGKKSGGQYSIDVDFLICQGPVTFNGNNFVFSSTGVEPFNTSGLNFYTGADGQANDPTFDSFGFPVNYSGSCRITGTPMDLGQSPVIPNLSFEITGLFTGTNSGPSYPFDANPSDIITDFLTNPRYGSGFPAVNLDDLAPGSGVSYGDYCQAAQLLVSVSLDGHQTAIEWLWPLVKLTNSAMVWSGKLLKIIPYGDLALSTNGATWAPNLTPLYSLTDDDFLPWRPRQLGRGPTPGEDDPILTNIVNAADVKNWVPIEYTDRSNYYNSTIISAFDQGLIDQFGLRLGDTIQGRAFCNPTSAQISAQLQLQRSIFYRATPIKFQGGWQYALVEPMDLLLLTGQFGDNYLQDTPVRILSVSENENGDLSFEAEEVQVGQNAPAPNPSPPSLLTPILVSGAAQHALGPFTQSVTVNVPDVGDWVVIMVSSMNTGLTEDPLAPAPAVIGIPTSSNLTFVPVYQNFPGPLANGLSIAPPNFASVSIFYAQASAVLTGEVITVVYDTSHGTSTGIISTAVVKGADRFDSNIFSVDSDFSGLSSTLSTGSYNTSRPNALLFSFFSLWGAGPPVSAPMSPWTLGATDTAIQAFDGISNQSGFDYYSVSTFQSSSGWPLYASQSNWHSVTFAILGPPA